MTCLVRSASLLLALALAPATLGCSLIASSGRYAFGDGASIDGGSIDASAAPDASVLDADRDAWASDAPPIDAGVDAMTDAPATDAALPPPTIVEIAPGFTHSCAVLDDRRLRCWGSNAFGQLGEGPDRNGYEDESITFEGTALWARHVAVADGVTCVVATAPGAETGLVLCRGDNGVGQLGNGTRYASTAWTAVQLAASGTDLADARSVVGSSAGTFCALRPGPLVCWGKNASWAEAGVADGGDLVEAVEMLTPTTGDTVDEVELRASVGCARLHSGHVWCWGSDVNGLRGDGPSITSRDTPQTGPTEVPGISDANLLSVQGPTACVVRSSGELTCWGQGAVLVTSWVPVPVTLPVPLATAVVSRIAGLGPQLWVETETGVFAWGRNDDGLLGGGEQLGEYLPSPTRRHAFDQVPTIGSGGVGCTLDGRCFGRDGLGGAGQLRLRLRSPEAVVATRPGGASALTSTAPPVIAANGVTACAVTFGAGNAVDCGGYNAYGAAADDAAIRDFAPWRPTPALSVTSPFDVAVSDLRAYVLDTPGSPVLRGTAYPSGPITESLMGATDLAAGADFRCFADATGVQCTGANGWGQLGADVASGAVTHLLLAAARIEAGEHFACALTRSPTLICWGQNDRGQLGRDSVATTGEPAAVSLEAGAIVDDFCVGANHACAIVGGDVLCWGDNDLGQVRDPARVVVRAPHTAWNESPATAVSCGRDHTCVQSAEGITCFGSDEFAVVSGAPRPFSGTLLRTGALASTAFAWSESGGLLAWGSNRYGLASPVDATTYVDVPTPVRTP